MAKTDAMINYSYAKGYNEVWLIVNGMKFTYIEMQQIMDIWKNSSIKKNSIFHNILKSFNTSVLFTRHSNYQ